MTLPLKSPHKLLQLKAKTEKAKEVSALKLLTCLCTYKSVKKIRSLSGLCYLAPANQLICFANAARAKKRLLRVLFDDFVSLPATIGYKHIATAPYRLQIARIAVVVFNQFA